MPNSWHDVQIPFMLYRFGYLGDDDNFGNDRPGAELSQIRRFRAGHSPNVVTDAHRSFVVVTGDALRYHIGGPVRPLYSVDVLVF